VNPSEIYDRKEGEMPHGPEHYNATNGDHEAPPGYYDRQPQIIMRDDGRYGPGDLVTVWVAAPGTGRVEYRVTGVEDGTVVRYDEDDRPITEPCRWLVGYVVESTARELEPWEVV
jgi:hypothetical protein